MKKQLSIIFMISFLLIVIALTGCSSDVSQLDIDLILGYEGAVKVSEGNPLTASITNNGEALTAELQIIIDMNEGESIIYAKEFQIPANGEKDISMVIPIYTIQSSFDVQIVAKGKTLYNEEIKADRFIAPTQPVIGVVTDKPDQYKFLKSAEYNQYYGENMMVDSYQYSMSSSKPYGMIDEDKKEQLDPVVFFFESMDELNKLENLEFFNYIYFGDHSNLKIGNQLEEKLLQWTNKGGTIIFETGDDYKRMYSFVPVSITNFTVKELVNINKETLFNMYELNDSVNVAIGNPVEELNTSFYEEDGIQLAMYTQHGSGQIINLLIDLTQTSLSDQPFKSKLIDEFLNYSMNESNSSIQDTTYYSYGQYTDMLRYIPIENNPPYLIMALTFGIYILLVGPIFYIIFKKKDRRDLIWIAIPIASVACLIILYIFGFGTRYNNPIINSISEIKYEDGNEYLDIYTELSVFNNESGNLKIDWSKSESLETISDYYGFYGEQRKTIKGKITSSNREIYEVYDTPLWSKVDFKTSKTIPVEIGVEEEFITIEIDNDVIDMTIFNKTPFDLETAYINWGNAYMFVGDIASMEKLEVRFKMTELYQDVYSMSQDIRDKYDLYNYNMRTINPMQSNLELYERTENNYYNGLVYTGNDARMITLKGVNHSPIGYDINVNDGEPDIFNKNIFEMTTDVDFKEGAELALPEGFVMPRFEVGTNEGQLYQREIENRGFEEQSLFVYQENLIYANFELPNYIDIDLLELKVYPIYLEQEYYERNDFGTINPIDNVIYEIYNAITNSYEIIDELDKFFEVDISSYVVDNKLIIRYLINSNTQDFEMNGKALQIPEIRIIGRAN